MPTYDYRCPNGHTFELFQRMSDPAPPGCEVCGAGPVEQVLGPVAVHFKGSGFYATDYGRGAKKKDESRDGAGGGETKKDKAAEKTAAASSSSDSSSSSSSSSTSPSSGSGTSSSD
jgi:putative FmdB family regulatory protein